MPGGHGEDVTYSGNPLPKAETLTDNAITFARKSNQEALRMLAAAMEYQNMTPVNMCSSIANLRKAIEELGN
jgi:hypothetical protein